MSVVDEGLQAKQECARPEGIIVEGWKMDAGGQVVLETDIWTRRSDADELGN